MRNIYCGQLNKLHIGKKVKICGWVNCYRNFGNFIFVNIRDKEGIVQVFFKPKYKKAYLIANKLKNEFCIQIKGIIYARPKNQINNKMITGEIEILATSLNVINTSNKLPIKINQNNNNEDLRLKFRYLDLRNPVMNKRLKIRSKILNFIHYFMKNENFTNIETPILTKILSEGARNYVVPSRIYKNKFYALNQSPQLFKQLLMIAGFDRYYQIAKCFRDENFRADRQSEFTQIDIEVSFINSKQIKNITERLIRSLWYKINGINLGHFKQITYKKAIYKFGSDKPDLRNPLKLIDITKLVKNSKFGFFSKIKKKKNKRALIIHILKKNKITNKKIKNYCKYIKIYGIKILPWIKINKSFSETMKNKNIITKFTEPKIIKKIINKTSAINGDILFFGANNYMNISNAFGALRIKIGLDLKILNKKIWSPLWVNNFPMFVKNNKKEFTSMHHPFTAPKKINILKLKKNPELIIADSYDMVINGNEIGGGSVRINNKKLQKIIFDILKIDLNKQKNKYGFLLKALKYGTPPHAGLAFGLDRISMLLNKTENIRDIIAFPKTSTALDLMIKAPDFITT